MNKYRGETKIKAILIQYLMIHNRQIGFNLNLSPKKITE